MLMIVRLYPKTDLSKVWNYIETQIKDDPKQSITPLYATQTEGMLDVGLIFDVKEPEDISNFLTEEIVKCDEIHHTKTISLMNPVFFPIPKKKPEIIQRYVIRIYAHPKYYKKVYEYLINYNYPFNLFPIYISYSLGDEDIIMSVAADHKETVNRFLREHVRTLDGVDQSSYYPVFKAKRFAPLAKLIEEQKEHLDKRSRRKSKDEFDLDFDWVENFEEYARLTGAFPGDY
jgi:DNA-binding Lrp family transcriptional regulator